MSRHENDYEENENHTGATSGSARSEDSAHGYRFSIANGAVTGIIELEHGQAQQRGIEYGETWTVSGSQVIKTEVEHGFTQTSTYADADGDGIFTKIAKAYSALTSSGNATAGPATLAIQGGDDTDDMWNGSGSSDTYYGAVGNDILRGGAGDDGLYGGNDNDDLYGDDGNDHLFGSNGDDHIYGGVGTDDATYEGHHTEYAIRKAASGIQLTDSNAARDGTDSLESVERIHFSDVSLALDTDGVAGKAYRLYKAAFDRPSDDAGLGHWIARLDKGESLGSVAAAFIASDEFQNLYGANCPDEQFVKLLYNNTLDRNPDAAGYEYWLTQLHGNFSREQVLVGFSESIENQNNVVELIANGITYQEWLA